MSDYGADFAGLRDARYGIGFHWTTATVPATGDPLPFEEAVEWFDVPGSVESAAPSGSRAFKKRLLAADAQPAGKAA